MNDETAPSPLTARVTARLTELDITHSGSLTPSQFRDIIAAIAPELQDAERRLREAETLELDMQRQRNGLIDSLAECRGLLGAAEARAERYREALTAIAECHLIENASGIAHETLVAGKQ